MLTDSNRVEKSMALVWAKLTDYGAGELKILDTYLSRINARNPESSRVTFTKKEYAALMGLDADIRTSQLKSYTKKLLKNVVSIDFPDGSGYDQYPLFYKATTRMDKDLGQIVIQIECHPELKEAFFDIAQDRYITYQLKNTIALKSQYSIRLYCALMAKQKYGWTVDVAELKDRLCANSPAYKEFKRFNGLVLKKAVEEINEVTNIRVDAEYIKKGRSVVAVKFSVDVVKAVDEEQDAPEEQYVLPAAEDSFDPNDMLSFYAGALPGDFTRAQVKVLVDIATDRIGCEMTDSLYDQQLRCYHYLQRKTLLMEASKPRSRFAWLRKAVAEDWT